MIRSKANLEKKDKNWSIYAGSTVTNSFRQLSKISAIENGGDYSLVYKTFLNLSLFKRNQ